MTTTRSQEKITPGCEWDWPPERRHLRASLIIDVDPPRRSGSHQHARERRIGDAVLRGIVLAVKIVVAIPLTMMFIFCVWLIYVILSP
jgi:hypothetical protein